MSVEEILKQALVGKQLRYTKYSKNITQKYSEYVKKSNSVTNSQFNSGNPKYRMVANREKIVGKHQIFDVATISSLEIYGDDYHGTFIRVRFDNGDFVDKDLYENIETL